MYLLLSLLNIPHLTSEGALHFLQGQLNFQAAALLQLHMKNLLTNSYLQKAYIIHILFEHHHAHKQKLLFCGPLHTRHQSVSFPPMHWQGYKILLLRMVCGVCGIKQLIRIIITSQKHATHGKELIHFFNA